MKITISQQVAEAYPALRIAIVVARGITNQHENINLTKLKSEKERDFTTRYTPEDINSHPYILAWRETYRSFGVKPKDYRPTAEALLRRIVRGDNAPIINIAVNCYLLAELECFLPIGGYDLDTIVGDITLRFSNGGEEFAPLGGAPIERTLPGEIVYADEKKILTRRWNYRDSDLAKITECSSNIVLCCEAADASIRTDDVTQSGAQVADYLNQFCGGAVSTFVVDVSDKRSWQL